METGLSQRQSQTMTLAPQLRQGLKMLAMSLPELRSELIAEMAKNPVIDDVEPTLEKTTFSEKEHEGEAAEQAEAAIEKYAKVAGLNGANPIPGLDVGVDLGIYFKMYEAIRDSYDIEEADIKKYMAVPVAKKLLELLTKQGVILILKNFLIKYW